MVSSAKNIYKCFGCGVGGGPVNFVMAYDKLDFIEAVEYLSERYHLPLEREKQDPQYEKRKTEQDLYYEINEKTKDYFVKELNQNINSLSFYLNKRGLTKEVLDTFSIGFAKESFNGLYNTLKLSSYQDKMLIDVGVVTNSKNGKLVDRFINRLMIPIFNEKGKVVGFGGRTLENSGKYAKYINTKETPIYNKSNILYGLNFSKNDIITQQEVIVVEGYMDLISLHQYGIKNVVAVSGTAFTDSQIKILKKYTKKIILCFDGDDAGERASEKMIVPMIKYNINCEVVTLPLKEDPDTYVRNFGKDAFIDYLKHKKQNILDYYIAVLLSKDSNQADILEKILQVISEIENRINLHFILTKLAQEFNIPISILNERLDTIERKSRYKKAESVTEVVVRPIQNSRLDKNIKKLENELMLIFLGNPEYLTGNLINMFNNDEIRIVLGSLLQSFYSKEFENKESFLETLTNVIPLNQINYLKTSKPTLINETDREILQITINDFLRKLEFFNKKKYIDKVAGEINSLQHSEFDLNDIKNILDEKRDLFLKLKKDLQLLNKKNYL